jgi:DNA-binding transcriptional ArsR family regulator
MVQTTVRQDLRRYEPRARIMKALAHPTRLFIVDRLARQEYCVNELTDMVGCDMSTMSKHLSVLRDAGIVRDEKRGACIYYTLRCPCILNFFTCTDSVLKTVRDEQGGLA